MTSLKRPTVIVEVVANMGHVEQNSERRYSLRSCKSTIVIFQENSNGEGADLVLRAGGEGWVHGTDDAQRLHHEREHLWAELGSQLDQSLKDAGQKGLENMCTLWQL